MNYGHTIHAYSVDHALSQGLQLIKDKGVPVVSRGMETLEVPGPVTTHHMNPYNRVLFNPQRDANPFFHFFEALWILSGSNTVAMPSFFLPRITDYSDNGDTFHGAYGHRLRALKVDQLKRVINVLKEKPDTRQAVMSIWDPELDLGADTKDVPCNDMVMLKVRNGRLNMTVCNRSNDVIWGAYGANMVQFSILQEFIAAAIGVGVGVYTQQSDSYHVYTSNPFWQEYANGAVMPTDMPAEVSPLPIFEQGLSGMLLDSTEALNEMFEIGRIDLFMLLQPYDEPFVFRALARPMLGAYVAYRAKDWDGCYKWLNRITPPDWRIACMAWVARRQVKAGAA